MEPKIFDMGLIGGKKFISFNEKIKDMMKEYDAITFELENQRGEKFAIVNFDDLILLLNKWKVEK